eukprot:scaffold342_cov106-Isochrysis_galbana.AAC.8
MREDEGGRATTASLGGWWRRQGVGSEAHRQRAAQAKGLVEHDSAWNPAGDDAGEEGDSERGQHTQQRQCHRQVEPQCRHDVLVQHDEAG